MISVSNRGFWAFGRQKNPVASFEEGSAPKLTPSYPPRLVEGSKTPIGRSGTRSAEQNLRGLPTNEYGKTVARADGLKPPRKRYNKGQLGRLTGPGFKIPAPIPWTFDAANKRLEGVDPNDSVVEDMIKGPLTPQGYIDLLKGLVKAERDNTRRTRLKAWRDELTMIAATADVYERQGRMPDADLQKRRDELHDEVDRWIVAKKEPSVGADGSLSTPGPKTRSSIPGSSGVATTVLAPTVKASSSSDTSASPFPQPNLPTKQSTRLLAEVQRRATQTNLLTAQPSPGEEEKRPPPPPPPRPSSPQTNFLEQIRTGGRPLRSHTEPRSFQLEPTLDPLEIMRQAATRHRSQIEPPSSLPAGFPSSEEILRTGNLGKGKGTRASLQRWKTEAGVSTSFQGAAGKTNAVLAQNLVRDIRARYPGWR